MSRENDGTLTIINEEGKEVTYDILFTFDSEENKKSYVVFTDNKVDPESGSIMTYAATYVEKDEGLILNTIEDDEEWELVENLLSQIEDKVANEAKEN